MPRAMAAATAIPPAAVSDWANTREMAAELRISVATLNRMLAKGAFKEGRHYRPANPFNRQSRRLWHRQRVRKTLNAD